MSRRIMPDPGMKRKQPSTLLQQSPQSIYQTYVPSVNAPTRDAQLAAAAKENSLYQQQRGVVHHKRRATTAAAVMKKAAEPTFAMYMQDVEEPTIQIQSQPGVKPRPNSGPILNIGLRPRIPLAVADHSAAQLAWNGISAREISSPTVTTQVVVDNTPKVKRSTISKITKPSLFGTANARKPRVSTIPVVQPPATFASKQKQARLRPALSTQPPHDHTTTTHLNNDMASSPYTIPSPTSAIASAPISTRPATFFDPFEMMYSKDSPQHLLSVSTKRFVVGKLSCKHPAVCHFLTDKVCYMFIHPYQENTQIMMEMHYNTMMDLRTPPTGHGAFSFKIPTHLPSFDGYGEYEPHLRNHRLTIEFNSPADLNKFKTIVYPAIQQQAIAVKKFF